MCNILLLFIFFFFKQKTAYEMRISDWSSDVCSSDLSSMRTANSSPETAHNCVTSALSLPIARTALPSSTSARLAVSRSIRGDRKSVVSGTSVSVRVDLGGRRIIKKKKKMSIKVKLNTNNKSQ